MVYNAHKRQREGQAKGFREVAPISTLIQHIRSDKYRLAAWIMYGTAQRVDACLWVSQADISEYLIFRKGHAKTKITHRVRIGAGLRQKLDKALSDRTIRKTGYLFPSRKGSKRPVLSPMGFDSALSTAIGDYYAALPDSATDEEKYRYHGVSSHTFRRSRLQHLYYVQGWKLTDIRLISGHKTIVELLEYLKPNGLEVDTRYMDVPID